MRITNITINTKKNLFTIIMESKTKLHYLQLTIRNVISRKTI